MFNLPNRINLTILLFGLILKTTGAENPEPTAKGTFWIIPHTHWEGAVFKTREEYLEMGLPHILTAIRLLKEHPNYRFSLDQAAYYRPFIERYPEEADAFKQFVREGRLQIVCGLNVMPDDNMPSGESFVRQMLYAKGYARETLGVDVKVGWLLDTFGHHDQMPQLLRLAGYNSFWFFRGVADRDKMPSEFLWQGLDGTQIPAFWLPFAYGHAYGPPRALPGFTQFMKDRYNSLAPFSRSADRVALAGVDVSEPELYVPSLVEQFNQQPNMPFTLKIGVPTDFEAQVARRTDLPVITGERNPLFQGIYSSRIELKQRMRGIERLGTTAEKFAAICSFLGQPENNEMTMRAWEPALFNVTHDLASGVMTDAVYEDTLRSYDFSRKLAEQLVEQRLGHILGEIDTMGQGVPIAVFNSLGWPRTDAAEGDVGFAEGGIVDFDLLDSEGKNVPAQLLETERFDDGGLRRVKFLFVARDVPPLGHSVYHLVPRITSGTAKAAAADPIANIMENEFYRLAFDLNSGALTNLQTKMGNWSALAGPGNVVAREADNGDFWELYKNLDGFQNVIMTRPLKVPERGKALFSDEFHDKPGAILKGPVFSEFKIKHALGTNEFSTRVRLYAGVSRIDFKTTILNRDARVRYRVLFPSSIKQGIGTHEIPFGAIERPQSQEYPAQNWIDFSDNERGLALLNRGNPGNNISDGTLMLSLMRSTSIQSYGIGGGFEGQGSGTGLELNKELTLDYGLVPHEGDWRAARVYRSGLEFNNPLIVHKAASHKGGLEPRWGFLHVSPANVVLSALKPSRDGAIAVRVYEASGKAVVGAAIRINARLISASEANLMEDSGTSQQVRGNQFQFDLHPFEIKTFKLRIER